MPRAYRKRDPKGNPERLLEAVGFLLREKGHSFLSTQQIARIAQVGKRYITEYFGGRVQLIKAYLVRNDFWLPRLNAVKERPAPEGKEVLYLFVQMLQEQMLYFLRNRELQKFILWQITETHPLMRGINELRETEGNKVIAMADDHFRGTGIDIHFVIGFSLGGAYFYGLQGATDNGPVCGRDLNNERDLETALKTFGQMMELCWWAADQIRAGLLDPDYFRYLNKD